MAKITGTENKEALDAVKRSPYENIKRQVQILALSLSQKRHQHLTIPDLANEYGVGVITINRAMEELRERGFDIHSSRKDGIILYCPDQTDEDSTRTFTKNMEKLIDEYLNICNVKNFPSRPTQLLVKKCGVEVIDNIVKLQNAIEKDSFVQVDYIKQIDIIDNRIIRPLMIYQDMGVWRLIAQVNSSIKTMRLEKIKNIAPTDKGFKKISPERIRDIFNYSWRSWISEDKYEVCFHAKAELAQRIAPRVFGYTERIEDQADGSIKVSVTVNSLEEIAKWIAGMGGDIKVLNPPELKKMVVKIGEGIINNYKES